MLSLGLRRTLGVLVRKRLPVFVSLVLAMSFALPSAAIAKTRTRLSASVTSAYQHYDKTPYVTGTLKTSSGKVLGDKLVKLYRGTTYVASKRTDRRGKVKFRASLPGSLMSGTWKLKYAGNTRYFGATSLPKATKIHVHYSGWAPRIDGAAGGTEDEGTGGSADDTFGDVVDDGADPAEEASPDQSSVFGIDVVLDGARTYQIVTSSVTACMIADAAEATVYSGDRVLERHRFAPATSGAYSVYLVSGEPGVAGVGELRVLIW